MTNENWKIERDQVPPRVFGRGAMMKHNIPLEELRPPRIDDDGEVLRDSLVLQTDAYPNEAEDKIGRIRAFVQRHVNKMKKAVPEKDVPKFSVMFGEHKLTIVIWRTK
tara:strand:+ start:610 stop:933 length:324 start_codon:yes stop_codon:yes gene_type:complete